MAIFIAAVMIIAATAAVPNLITESRRQKEELLIWRGKQYARAIGLYYRKTGHYPHDLRELAKGIDGVHFLRQRYKDPMNTQDGSWRLIYLGPGGQLIGSLRWQTLAEYQAAELGQSVPGTTTPGATGTKPAVGLTGTPMQGTAGDNKSHWHPQIINEGQMVGGSLIGVASKVDAKSLKVYMGAENYRDWEFIWNPLQGQQTVMPGAQPTTGTPTSSGPPKAPTGTTPPTSPSPQPQQP
jgi:type II secretory pathway pseudopilin PulG